MCEICCVVLCARVPAGQSDAERARRVCIFCIGEWRHLTCPREESGSRGNCGSVQRGAGGRGLVGVLWVWVVWTVEAETARADWTARELTGVVACFVKTHSTAHTPLSPAQCLVRRSTVPSPSLSFHPHTQSPIDMCPTSPFSHHCPTAP